MQRETSHASTRNSTHGTPCRSRTLFTAPQRCSLSIRFDVTAVVFASPSPRWATIPIFVATPARAQARGRAAVTSPRDSAAAAALENEIAVIRSGVWTMDGEYKNSSGVYYKLTGYFSYVASTSTSIDKGDAAVIAMYLEPLAGGSATWISARLFGVVTARAEEVRCLAAEGATQLLDVNFTFRAMPVRGARAEAEITEPDDKTAADRFSGRSTNRGRFALVPIQFQSSGSRAAV